MIYNITIKQLINHMSDEARAEAAALKATQPICPVFGKNVSYVDTPAFAGTAYDTNVEGWGKHACVEPYASTGMPFPAALAQFKLAAIGTEIKDEAGNVIGHEITFTTEDYKEAFFYAQLGAQMADQGFVVECPELKPAADEADDEASDAGEEEAADAGEEEAGE